MTKKILAVAAAAALALTVGGGVANAAEGNAYGKTAKECVAQLGIDSLGAGIQAGRAAHLDAKITAKTIAESIHCS